MERDEWHGFDASDFNEEDRRRLRWTQSEWEEFRATALMMRSILRVLPVALSFGVACVGLGIYLASQGLLGGSL